MRDKILGDDWHPRRWYWGRGRWKYNVSWCGCCWWLDCTSENVSDFGVSVEDWGAESEWIVNGRVGRNIVGQQVEHVFCGLFEVGITGDSGKNNLFGEEIDLEDIAFVHGVGEVALPASVVFQRGTNVPTNLAMFAEGRSNFSRGVGDDLGTHGSERSPIEIELAEKRGMSGKGRVDSRGPEQIESQCRLRE